MDMCATGVVVSATASEGESESMHESNHRPMTPAIRVYCFNLGIRQLTELQLQVMI